MGIGASAGGLDALTGLLQHLPPDTGMGFVLVQHLDPEHESALTQILSRATSMPVYEVVDNLPVETNHIYVIPPNQALKYRPRDTKTLSALQVARAPAHDRLFSRVACERSTGICHWSDSFRHGFGRDLGIVCDQGGGRNHLCAGSIRGL